MARGQAGWALPGWRWRHGEATEAPDGRCSLAGPTISTGCCKRQRGDSSGLVRVQPSVLEG